MLLAAQAQERHFQLHQLLCCDYFESFELECRFAAPKPLFLRSHDMLVIHFVGFASIITN